MISEILLTGFVSFIFGGAIGWVLGVHFTRPREETKISYEIRGWIFKDLVQVITKQIRYRGLPLSETTKERIIDQKVDLDTFKGLRNEAESFTDNVLRFLPLTGTIRRLLGK